MSKCAIAIIGLTLKRHKPPSLALQTAAGRKVKHSTGERDLQTHQSGENGHFFLDLKADFRPGAEL